MTLFKIAAANTSKEAWEILKEEFHVRGSSTNTIQNAEAIVNPAEADESNEEVNFTASMIEAKYKHIDEVYCVYATVDDEGNEESNVEIKKINNEGIDRR